MAGHGRPAVGRQPHRFGLGDQVADRERQDRLRRITTPLPPRSVPRIDAVNASSGTTDRSTATASSVGFRSNATSLARRLQLRRKRPVSGFGHGTSTRARAASENQRQCVLSSAAVSCATTGARGLPARDLGKARAIVHALRAEPHGSRRGRVCALVDRIRFDQPRAVSARIVDRTCEHLPSATRSPRASFAV